MWRIPWGNERQFWWQKWTMVTTCESVKSKTKATRRKRAVMVLTKIRFVQIATNKIWLTTKSMRSWETLHLNKIFHPQTPHTTSSSSPPLLLVVQIILMSYPTDDARHPPTRTKLSSTTNTYPFIIIQQLPVLATFTPALNAKHSLEYSLPSHPQTGSYNSMQTCCPDGVQVRPFEQDVVQELEAVCTPPVGEL